MTNININSLPNLQKKKAYLGNIEKNQIKPRKLDVYDNYIIIYFKKDIIYYLGFNNKFRENINFIINTKDNTKFNKEDYLSINKNYGIEFHFGEKVTELNSFFSKEYDNKMEFLISVDFSYFDSSSLSNIGELFVGYNSLESVEFSNFDSSSLLNMDSMFERCTSLKSINLSNFDTSLVTNMSFMFDGCRSLKSLNLSNWKTPSLIDIRGMFSDCTSLESINLSNFNLSIIMVFTYYFIFYYYIFDNCISLSQ